MKSYFQNPYRLHEANGTHKTIDNTTPVLILFFILTASHSYKQEGIKLGGKKFQLGQNCYPEYEEKLLSI